MIIFPLWSSKIWVHTLSRKYLSCVTMSKVMRWSLRYRSSHSIISKSKWLVGSSRINISGSPIKVLVNATRFFSHHESDQIFWSRNGLIRSLLIAILSSTSCSRCCKVSKSKRNSRTVWVSFNLVSWERYQIRTPSLRSIAPSLTSISCMSNLSKVVFPAQFLATKAIFCHLEIVKSTWSTRTLDVYDLARLVALRYNIN